MPFFVFGGCGGRFYCPALEKRKKRLSDFLDSLFNEFDRFTVNLRYSESAYH